MLQKITSLSKSRTIKGLITKLKTSCKQIFTRKHATNPIQTTNINEVEGQIARTTREAQQTQNALKAAESEVELVLMNDKEAFCGKVQEAFQKDFEDVFGPWEQTVLPTEDIERSLTAPGAETFFAKFKGKIVGGTSVAINPETQVNDLNLFYVNSDLHSQGIGQKFWKAIEEKFPDTKVWECWTPHYSVRNINLYMNKLGFKIKGFYNKHHQLPGVIDNPGNMGEAGWNFFHFEKVMKP